MIPIARPLMGDEEKQAVLAVLDSGILAQGPRVEAFERSFAAYCEVEFAVATSSGTTALHLALLALGIGPGDEVITSPFSFIATANAIRYVGAVPVFADIEPDTFNLDPAQAEKQVTPRTRAVMPVHLFGHPAEMDPLLDLARRHGLAVIEDACQAHGATYRGRKAGSFGTACFSFYPTKNMTCGEGGMVTTDDAAVADQVRLLRNHGMRRRYYHETLGYNFRMTDLHAAIGLSQLGRLEAFNQARIANADYLTRGLRDVIACPVVRPDVRHVFHQYTVRVPKGRDAFKERLRALGVDSGIYYPVPLHHQGSGAAAGAGHYPATEAACEQVLSLPVHPALTRAELEQVVSAVRQSLVDLA